MHDDCSSKISQSLTIACRVLGPLQQTELCKTLAACYYGSEKDMIRIDMSEYMEKHVRIIIAIWSTVESQCVDLNTDSCLFVVFIFSLFFPDRFAIGTYEPQERIYVSAMMHLDMCALMFVFLAFIALYTDRTSSWLRRCKFVASLSLYA
jgi:hypothetical protein